jgi:hypothetical protein
VPRANVALVNRYATRDAMRLPSRVRKNMIYARYTYARIEFHLRSRLGERFAVYNNDLIASTINDGRGNGRLNRFHRKVDVLIVDYNYSALAAVYTRDIFFAGEFFFFFFFSERQNASKCISASMKNTVDELRAKEVIATNGCCAEIEAGFVFFLPFLPGSRQSCSQK